MSWLSRFNSKKSSKKIISIQVEPHQSRKSKKNDVLSKSDKHKDTKVACSEESLGLESTKSNFPAASHKSEPADWAEWMKSTGIVTAVYVEPNVEEYEYGIFTFHFPSLRTEHSKDVTVEAVAAHIIELQILTKYDEALQFCRSISGDSSTITASAIVDEAKGARKYTRVICKRYIKAVYDQQIEGILANPNTSAGESNSSSSEGISISNTSRRGKDAWALGNTAHTVQRKYSRADSSQNESSGYSKRTILRKMSSHNNRDTVLKRIVSRVASRVISRQSSSGVSERVSERPHTPAARRSSAVTLGIAKRIRDKECTGPNEDELTPDQKKQVEDFLKKNGYDEY